MTAVEIIILILTLLGLAFFVIAGLSFPGFIDSFENEVEEDKKKMRENRESNK